MRTMVLCWLDLLLAGHQVARLRFLDGWMLDDPVWILSWLDPLLAEISAGWAASLILFSWVICWQDMQLADIEMAGSLLTGFYA